MANSGMSGFDEGQPGEHPNYGWNRASVQYRSFKLRRPNVKADDLLMPNGLGTMQMLRSCILMAGMMTVLYVWIPLLVATTFLPISNLTYALTLGLAFLSITLFLYFAGSRETRRDRDLASRL
jgi:hypothetical protein